MTQRGRTIAVAAFVLIFLAVALYQFAGVCQDWIASLGFRYELDYGEGIVWQQALLMFGPRMYSPSEALPFIVFHYPPLYHILVRALWTLGLDQLMAGRLVSLGAVLVAALAVGALVLAGTRDERRLTRGLLAVAIAVMFLCLNPIRQWGVLMRVDMLAVTLGMVGTLIFVRSRGSTAGMTAALLMCVASLFAKQTQLPAGISVFVIAMAYAPRRAIIASVIAGSIGLAAVAALEATTGGFLKNIISYNVNPIDLRQGLAVIWGEREEAALVLLMGFGAIGILSRIRHETDWVELRRGDIRTMTRYVVVLHFVLACLSSIQVIKDGANINYFLDLLASGCVLIGLFVCELGAAAPTCTAIAILLLSTANLRHREVSPVWFNRVTISKDQLVERVEKQDKPVLSDDMVLLLRAGKSVFYEPAIIRVLVASGKWDPAPLYSLLRQHEFAFAVTFRSYSQSGPAVTTVIEDAYPRLDTNTEGLTVHNPP